jgi:DNA-binding NtrC family response regulator
MSRLKLPLELLGSSAAADWARACAEQAASCSEHVLVRLDQGMSAERVARAIHDGTAETDGPFVACDCAVGPAGRIESDLFGAGRRAGGPVARVGGDSAIARAAGGTLFLSEIEELPSSVQARLGQLMRDGEISTGPESSAAPLGVRVIAGAMKDLDGEIRDGRFRRDLYQRFTIRLEVPALRQRPGDIPVLVHDLALSRRDGDAPEFSREALMLLAALPWRRNLQELEQVVQRLAAAGRNDLVRLEDVLAQVQLERAPAALMSTGTLQVARRGFEHDYIASVLNRHEWRMGEAARTLGLQRPNLYRKVRQLGLARFRTRS